MQKNWAGKLSWLNIQFEEVCIFNIYKDQSSNKMFLESKIDWNCDFFLILHHSKSLPLLFFII